VTQRMGMRIIRGERKIEIEIEEERLNIGPQQD
jgi:hypothetical protein